MPSFVISWLTNFKICAKNRKVEQISSDVSLEVLSSFYMRLMNPFLNSKWEIIAFREFLL